MKSLFKYIALVAVAFFATNCSDNYEQPEDYARGMSTSNTDVSIQLAVNRVVTFMDLSRMVESREWVLDEGVEFLSGDKNSQRVSIKFTGEGLEQKVTLKVKLQQPDLAVVAKNEQYEANGEYDLITDPQLYTETYSYVVLNAVTTNILSTPSGDNASGGIQDPALFLEDGFSYANYTVYIETGNSVEFEAVSTGFPSEYTWSLPGSNHSGNVGGSVVDGYNKCQATYNAPGTYNVTVEAKRVSPASTATRTLTAFVVVTDPVLE